jgi:hypothetical protein
MRDMFGYASALSLLLAAVAVGCSGEDDPEQSNLPVFGQGGTGGAAPVGANGGTGGAPPVGGGGTAPVAANGGTGGAPAAANGGTGGAPAANGGTGGAPGAGGTGTGAGGTASVPPGMGGMGMGGAGMEPPPTGESVSFEDDVWPIFMTSCGPCHTTSGSGGHSVGSPVLATALADAQRLGETLVTRLDGGGMPFGCATAGVAPCISITDLETVEAWVDGGELP